MNFTSGIKPKNGRNKPDTEEGKYGWDVPAGEWKVSFTGRGINPVKQRYDCSSIHDQVNTDSSTKAPQVRTTLTAADWKWSLTCLCKETIYGGYPRKHCGDRRRE